MLEMSCEVCGTEEESDLHVLCDYPFAEMVGEANGTDSKVRVGHFRTIWDSVENGMFVLERNKLGKFVAILAEC